jgi:pyruvate ferredoxin oxidoreductase alpha subunit
MSDTKTARWTIAPSVPKGLTGDGAAAEAARQINPDVVAAYPITPQTETVERFAEYVADGLVTTEFVAVESEHSALSACCGSAAAGARTWTATASQGLALMHEILFIAAGQRLPIVMTVVNRNISAPINIHCDHSDAMASRECGWIQIFCHDAQEVYDSTIQAFRIAERSDVFLPVMVCLDGFITSHDMERVETLPDEKVREFVGEYNAPYNLLDAENPVSAGMLAGPPHLFEHKVAQYDAMKTAKQAIVEVANEYAELAGRSYGLTESYLMDDAEVAIVAMSTGAGTARVAADRARAKGIKAGVVRVRSFRPFPTEEVVAALNGKKVVAVLDRAASPGATGAPLFQDIRTAMYDAPARPKLVNYVFGLGGRDLTVETVTDVFERLATENVAESQYLGVRQ